MICEGFNDGMIVESIMAKSKFTKNQVNTFHQKSVPMQEKKHAETTLLRSFLHDTPYNPFKFLVKLEGGKYAAIKIFCRELVRLIENVDCILMVDLDNETPQKRMESLSQEIENTRSQTTPIKVNIEKESVHNHLYHFSCSVLVRGTRIGEFQVVFFKVSLENSCSIEKGDSKEVKQEKINQFIEEEKIQDFFDPIVN